MARQIAHTGVLALALCSTGCTSILGDFAVGPALDGGASHMVDTGAQGDDAEADVEPHQDAATGQDGDAQVDGAQLVEADLVDAAADVDPVLACVPSLADVGTSDFTVAFTITTTATVSTALVNQRAACVGAEWDVYMSPTGAIEIETETTASDRVYDIGGTGVNDGNPHHVQAGRAGGELWVQVDDTPMSPLVADTNALGTLPALVIGTDACSTTAAPLVGSLTDLCITRP
jgi:hypothetical protein